jgi:predicted DCC family thiol-disulfide oxidoreductase YuxK
MLFDGVCNLCNGAVDFVLRHDKDGRVCVAALQSEAGRRLLAEHGLSAAMDSVVLIEGGRSYERSGAVLRLSRLLGMPWRLLYGAMVIPAPLRDRLYDWVASRRYRWFGRRDSCRTPTAAERARFLE